MIGLRDHDVMTISRAREACLQQGLVPRPYIQNYAHAVSHARNFVCKLGTRLARRLLCYGCCGRYYFLEDQASYQAGCSHYCVDDTGAVYDSVTWDRIGQALEGWPQASGVARECFMVGHVNDS